MNESNRNGRGSIVRSEPGDRGALSEPLLTAVEAAELLHVPRSTLYELVRSRHLPHVKVGRGLRFTRAGLAAWVDENTYR